MEIERKFLIKKELLPAELESYPFHEIEQGYLCTNPVVRIRRQMTNIISTYKSKPPVQGRIQSSADPGSL